MSEQEHERHDRLFRHTFEDVDNAKVELRTLLPASIWEQVDASTLQVESGALRGKGQRLECDMLYSAELAGKLAYIYVLLEHQSSVDRLMAFRMLQYVSGILERWLKSHPGVQSLPIVLPLVVHHSETGWTAATDLHSLFDQELLSIEGVKELVPQLSFLLDDVSRADNAKLLSRAQTPREQFVSFALWALRDGRNPERLRENLPGWLQVIGEIWEEEGAAILFEEVFWYISLAEEGLKPQDLEKAAERAALPAKEALMTLAEELRQEGHQKGLQKGRQEGRQEGEVKILLKQLQLKFGELSEATKARVMSANGEELESFSERVLTASSLEEVLK